METDEEHRRPLTGGARTPPGDKTAEVAANPRSAPATPEPLSMSVPGLVPGHGGRTPVPSLDARLDALASLSPAPGPEVLLMRPDSAKASPPALPPRPRVPPRPASMAAGAAARGRNGAGGCGSCGLCWRGGGLRKYVFLCAACGGLSSLLGILFLAVYFLLRSYTSSLVYFETVPTYVPASMLLSTGLVVMCLARRRNRYSFLMKLCGGACLASAALCVLVTVATTVVHMSRLQSLSQCHYQQRTQTCTCYSAVLDERGHETDDGARYVFNSIPDCDVIHGALYSCLRAMFGLSVVGILVCIFSGMLVYQLFSHEKKKMYWEQLELRCRYLYRRQQAQPTGQALQSLQGLPHAPMAHHCGSCSCCDDCRELHTPPPSIPWEFMDSRYWAPGRVGNLYSPSPEDQLAGNLSRAAAAGAPGERSGSGSAWSWRRLPWGRSSGGAGAGAARPAAVADGSLCGLRMQGGVGVGVGVGVRNAPSPDSQYGFGALGQLGRDPSVGPYLLSQVYPAPQPHPRPFAQGPVTGHALAHAHAHTHGVPGVPGMPMPLSVPMPLAGLPLADDLGPQFYLWGPPPPYMSNPASAANSPARRDPSQAALPAAPVAVVSAASPAPAAAAAVRTVAQRQHRCSALVTASPAAAHDRPLSAAEDAGSASALDSLSSPEKTVPRKKRKKASASADGPSDGGTADGDVPPQQPESPESPTPPPAVAAQAAAGSVAPGMRKTKKRSDACVVPGGRHAARYAHRTRAAHAAHRPASADSCCPGCAERACCQRSGDTSDDVDTEGYSYPRLKFPPPQPTAQTAPPSDSQAILAAFDNQAFQDAASECQPRTAPGHAPGGGPVKTLTLGPQGPLVCKKRPSDPNESEVYFGDDSSCCNVSEPHSSLTYDEGRELRELRAFKLVHTHGQQRSMDAALPMRPVAVHRPSASTLSDTAVDPHYRLHPIECGAETTTLRQRMPLPLPQAGAPGVGTQPGSGVASLAPDAQYESIADSNVYTYISPLSLGPGPGAGRRSFKQVPCESRGAPDRPEPSVDDKQNAVNAQRESSAAVEATGCLSEDL